MSILIKGLKMPEKGTSVVIAIEANGDVFIPDEYWDCELLKGAKAVELPDHGDLIDRDVLMHNMVEIIPRKVFDFVPVIIPAERSEE